ncbi:ATP-NAD kinase family protein [Rheinheimera sp. MMS21-TC3]|uniref:ATP-NAD kinase family protein n=1 Tax=Rheinheimera sp. MMS21-TC3 TaxID=3072790 RepID=UPI0028C438BC|nr:ATP-NAD kinase family protein [Rheinheimera sp. MMS21-TC3]WNO60733.1 ATP-NAD kinase family protein [Rheinheimera sp. MMS21-TC3]
MAIKFRLGLIINPLAGLGGSVGLKGSDGQAEQALALGAVPQAMNRAETTLTELLALKSQFEVYTVAGDMGENVCKQLGLSYQIIYKPKASPSTAQDTELAAQALVDAKVDLILFAGGDGTARNICHVVAEKTTVLGIPAGVKIHSGVYAISPTAAGKLVAKLVAGELVSLDSADVMDIDEEAFRQGIVKARRFGEMRIPAQLRYVQSVKAGGQESDELVLADLAAYVSEQMEDNVRYVMGSGSTVAAIMQELGLDNTLLGVDVVENGQLIAQDVTADQLFSLIDGYPSQLIITLIGGQGHVFGRGNQQLSPKVIRCLGRSNIQVIATKEKLEQLQGRPLLADTGDTALDHELAGLINILTGYNDYVMYRLGWEEEE